MEQATYLGTVPGRDPSGRSSTSHAGAGREVVANAFGCGMDARGMLTRRRNPRTVIAGDVLALYTRSSSAPTG
ncbi:MAG: hypothetical protein R3F11_15005 [Verrucomicrobiales bacterium]